MSSSSQPTKMQSRSFRESARWPWLLLCVALPFLFLARVVTLNTDTLWILTLFVIAACLTILFIRAPAIAHTSLTRACLRLYLLSLALALLWCALNQVRVSTYDNAVEGQFATAAKLYWFVTIKAQPTIRWCTAVSTALFVIAGIIGIAQYLINVRSLKNTHV